MEPRTLRLLGALNRETVAELDLALEKAKARQSGDLTLDLSCLAVVDTAGIRMLIRTALTLAGGRIADLALTR